MSNLLVTASRPPRHQQQKVQSEVLPSWDWQGIRYNLFITFTDKCRNLFPFVRYLSFWWWWWLRRWWFCTKLSHCNWLKVVLTGSSLALILWPLSGSYHISPRRQQRKIVQPSVLELSFSESRISRAIALCGNHMVICLCLSIEFSCSATKRVLDCLRMRKLAFWSPCWVRTH